MIEFFKLDEFVYLIKFNGKFVARNLTPTLTGKPRDARRFSSEETAKAFSEKFPYKYFLTQFGQARRGNKGGPKFILLTLS